ncbi:MAG: hypothetical protein M3Q71_14845 [Chloroflexota bacterium]|nr:hypothetical protein [Chloroflexota bacterium]
MTTTWAAAAEAKARGALPRLQAELDAARLPLDDLRQRMAAVERATAALDPDADPDVAVAVQVAGETLPPLVAAAEAVVVAAVTARREARSSLLPPDESPWSRIAAARQADRRRQGELDAVRSRVGELQRGRAAALGVVREAGPGSNMTQLAAAEAELRLSERELPGARDALAAAEEAAQQARAEVDAMQARTHALRGEVLTGEPQQAEVALAELLSLVGEERSGWWPR